MARLIDADALWKKLELEPWYDNADRDEIALPMVDAAPTVEVVLCKDCLYYSETIGKDSGKPCGYGSCCVPGHITGIVYDEDFCSRGERNFTE